MRAIRLAALTTLLWYASASAAPRVLGPEAPPSPARRLYFDPWLATPYHGSERFGFGGNGELRFHYDRVFGDADPDWLSVGRLSAFTSARIGLRLSLMGEAAYDRVTDDLLVEQASIACRTGHSTRLHAGILPLPLGPANRFHEAPDRPLADPTLVASELLGLPASQIGAGIRGLAGSMGYEVDLVTGYGGGVLVDAPDGTRLASGRNGAGVAALSGRLAWGATQRTGFGISGQCGALRLKDPQGVTFGAARFLSLAEADLAQRLAGFDIGAEAAFVGVDVPPGLEGAFAQTQWGASITVTRGLLDPLIRGWKGSSLSAALRAETVDHDRSVPGDSKQRLSASLDFRHRPWAVMRWGWYYEIRRDRFDNATPAAGLLLTTATYF